MKLNRRQLLKALGFSAVGLSGLGTFSKLGEGSGLARASGETPPTRIVFYVQPHGHVPNAYRMPIDGAPGDQFAERSLVDVAEADLSSTLRPLFPYRDRILAIEGLSNTAAIDDIAAITKAGSGDLNNHQIGVADILTGTHAHQRQGTYCTGGARSIDQVLASRLAGPGRFDSRVYGFDYIPNSIVSPFSYLGPGQATPVVADPAAAFADLMGYLPPAPGETDRASVIRSFRSSVLDTASREYDLLAPGLGKEGREKLEQHRDLIRALETSLGTIGPAARCGTSYAATAPSVRQFMDLTRIAFACDLTRVVTFVAPVPQCPDLGYPADMTFHTYAHQSIEGATSCGAMYTPEAARAMTDLDAWHAQHFAYLLGQLDSVAEGSGTLLDHTIVVWMTELATPTHLHHNGFTIIAGGGNGFFKTGRYLRYPQTGANPYPSPIRLGPAHNRLLVSLLQAMGQNDDTFGMSGATASDGSALSFRGPLAELRG